MDYISMKGSELKNELKNRTLSVDGDRDSLIQRLKQNDDENNTKMNVNKSTKNQKSR